MPETLMNYITRQESFSVSGEKNRGEGADFVHENSNRTTKSLLPPGMPTAETWRRVCQKRVGKYEKSSKRYKKYDNKVTMMRGEKRSNQFIKMSPQNSSDIISIDGHN